VDVGVEFRALEIAEARLGLDLELVGSRRPIDGGDLPFRGAAFAEFDAAAERGGPDAARLAG
jgi:hypothetical protein